MYVVDKATMCLAEKLADKSGTDFFTLMQNAGNAAANYIAKNTDIKDKKIFILCGKGNNGGDGFVMANRLALLGAHVFICLPLGAPVTDIANKAYGQMAKSVSEIDTEIALLLLKENKFDIIIDALFGTGFRGEEPKGKIKEFFDIIKESDFAIDIPSGLECDEGKGYETALKTKCTITFEAKKLCHVLPKSADICGNVVCLPIGIGEENLITAGAKIKENEQPYFERRPKTCHKNSFGIALSVTGSYGMSGAAVLSCKAALKTGVGILKAACITENYQILGVSIPEAVLIPLKSNGKTFRYKDINVLKESLKGASAMLIGCGLSVSSETIKITKELLLSAEVPTVLDADGINIIAEDIELLRKVKAPVVLTPHPAEMARLLKCDVKTVEANRFKTAADFSKEYGVYTVLKGANTIIASPTGELAVNTNGNAGMAKAGSGDMLSGILLSLLAKGEEPFTASKAAVWLHAAAGDKALELFGETAMLPSDMIDQLYRFL